MKSITNHTSVDAEAQHERIGRKVCGDRSRGRKRADRHS